MVGVEVGMRLLSSQRCPVSIPLGSSGGGVGIPEKLGVEEAAPVCGAVPQGVAHLTVAGRTRPTEGEMAEMGSNMDLKGGFEPLND